MYRNLIVAAAALAFFIVVLGAFVRLNDAGLGCPDWPGCYGHVGVPDEPHELAAAREKFPAKPVEAKKAWIEMVHRYFASALGLLILIIAVVAWQRRDAPPKARILPSLLVALVVFQGLLGMWTVTLLLKPAIVTAHLLGGLATLALLVWLALGQFERYGSPRIIGNRGLRLAAAAGLAILAIQIALGGWVSTNYAALACSDFPRCQGEWAPRMDFANSFHVKRELGMTASGELLSLQALTAIHWSHRMGALVSFVFLGLLGLAMLRDAQLRGIATALLAALGLQAVLGIGNVMMSLPLALAVAHNAGAAVLLVVLVAANYRLNRRNPWLQPYASNP
jgi:heme a synthase